MLKLDPKKASLELTGKKKKTPTDFFFFFLFLRFQEKVTQFCQIYSIYGG